MSEATQLTQISDNVNQGYIAGRDLYLGDQYVNQETLYFEPDLRGVEPPAWPTTEKSHELAEALSTQRLIVLAGQDLDDKTMVARHLAWLLRQNLQPDEVMVREWYRSSDPQKIETAFHPTGTTILLLPQVLPHHVGHRLTELRRLLQSSRNYLIITTEGTREEWGIRSGSSEERFWREISWETYYGRSFLSDRLLEELTASGGRLPEWLPRDLQPGSLLVEGLTLEEAAARLRQPDRIRQFAQWLGTQGASAPRDLLAKLDQLGGDHAAIFHWYRQLDRRDQLLALGLVLFDGLPDGQIFAALEFLVNEAWRQTDPNLPLFDYHDLARLGAYFHIAVAGEDGTRIETTSRQKREEILKASWEFQRRRLLTIVPAITRLIKELNPYGAPSNNQRAEGFWKNRRARGTESKSEPADALWRFSQGPQRELFSSPRRVEQLQRSVIESLSQIGLLSFEAVEASFLALAVDGTTAIKTVVAKALAAWRGDGHSDQLFTVLGAWWEDGCTSTLPKSLPVDVPRVANPFTAMRATVALAAGYAFQYDAPNCPAPQLLGLLQVLVQDRNPLVRQSVLELTLPLAVASHLRQLEPLIRNQLIADQEHMYAVAFGTAMAYSLRPSEVVEIIERWHAMVRSQGPRDADSEITQRDRLLSTVALAYGYIRCDQVDGLLTPDQIVSQLRSILNAESHPFVRTQALMAMGLQAVQNFELAAPTLLELISEITLADRLHVVSVFVRAYLKQREHLSGGDEIIDFEGRFFPTWTSSSRPFTAIELSLFSWLRDDNHPVAQQVAVQTFAAISTSGLEVKERILTSQRLKPGVVVSQRTSILKRPKRLRRLNPLGEMALLFMAPRKEEDRALLRPVMAEVLAVQRTYRPLPTSREGTAQGPNSGSAAQVLQTLPQSLLLPSVLGKWRTAPDSAVNDLARTLSRTLLFYRFRWIIVAIFLYASAIAYIGVRDWINKLFPQQPAPVEQPATTTTPASPTTVDTPVDHL